MSIASNSITNASITNPSISGVTDGLIQDDGLLYSVISEMAVAQGLNDGDEINIWTNKVQGQVDALAPTVGPEYDSAEDAAELNLAQSPGDINMTVPGTTDYIVTCFESKSIDAFGTLAYSLFSTNYRILQDDNGASPDRLQLIITTNLQTAKTVNFAFTSAAKRRYYFYAIKNDADPTTSTFGISVFDGQSLDSEVTSTYSHGTGFNTVTDQNYVTGNRPAFISKYGIILPKKTPDNITAYIAQLNSEF